MANNAKLNQHYEIFNSSCDELKGMTGKCEGYYASDMTFPIIRLERPLSNGQHSIVISSDNLKSVKKL